MVGCTSCSATAASPTEWRCGECAAPLRTPLAKPDRATLAASARGVGRYRRWLETDTIVSLGEPETPLVELDWHGVGVHVKLEGALPTGSFKDRGTAVLFGALLRDGVTHIVEDSSGNAGASFAAYAAAAEIEIELFVPASASPSKLAQAVALGATLRPVDGPRQAATDAAIAFACERDLVYASHQWQPVFNLGTQTFAFELWEQLGEQVPDAVVCPVGAGGMLLGVYLGFRALREAGLTQSEPRIVGVQSAACAPLARAFAEGLDGAAVVERGQSVAEGVLLTQPPRAGEILAAVRSSNGAIIALDDETLWSAHERLRKRGLLVEATSALAPAALGVLLEAGVLDAGETIVVAATGHGLKTAQSVAARLER